MTIHIDVKPSGYESAVVGDRFDKAVPELTGAGYDIIPLDTNAHLRIEQGRKAPITTNGNYVAHAIVHAKGAQPLFVRASPLVTDLNLATQAVDANRQGRYFNTPTRELYEQSLALAKEDRGKDPIQRRVLVLPSRGNFEVSGRKNPEQFEGMLGEFGAEYLKFVDLKKLDFYTVDPSTVDSQDGTLITQLWFWGRGDLSWSELRGVSRDLNGGDGVRGVRQISGGAGAQKISDGSQPVVNSELYTPQQVSEALHGTGISGNLEATILKGLRAK